ncbi:MAG: L,D-transpeptidase [Leptospiraceae bacterium]|nr:L,D-transpeptidase [Leptospiraceae bacterium]
MYIIQRNGESIWETQIGYGSNPDGKAKLHEGDNRTPEGFYKIQFILSSRDPADSSTAKRLRELNQKEFKAQDGYTRFGSNQDEGTDIYGPLYFGINYPNQQDLQRYQKAKDRGQLPSQNGELAGPGFGIAIHGTNDPASIGQKHGSGCIRVHNNSIIQLDRWVRKGTPVFIMGRTGA